MSVQSGNEAHVLELLEAQTADYFQGSCPEMAMTEKVISEIARTDIPVLLTGESGTGKEIVAYRIHSLSEQRLRPFVKVTCASLTMESFRSRLNGLPHEVQGATASAVGTLFLDDIGEIDANGQRHLLHAIPDDSRAQAESALNCRLISCTASDLDVEVQAGRFRRELFYRLNHARIHLPPLRQRRADIPGLVQFFLRKFSKAFGRQESSLTGQTMNLLLDHSWPGNIRELEAVVKKIVALGSEELGITDLRVRPAAGAPSISASRSLRATARAASREAERQLILQTLETTRWNRRKAAEVLQISYKALLYKLKQIYLPDSQNGVDHPIGGRF